MSTRGNSGESFNSNAYVIPVCVFLCLSILVVYWQVTTFDFILYDDPLYVAKNPDVSKGLTFGGIWWAFTTVHASNWHPLTWVSHMLDVQLFGMNPGMHHVTNVIIHIANTVLLFIVLWKMTGAVWRSAVVAALFGVHPLHVQSVAWISERKDVLSTFFWIAAMFFYYRYAGNRNMKNYLLVTISFILGILSKPMVVTLPFVLLLLDFWPLNRLGILSQNTGAAGNHGSRLVIPGSMRHRVLLCIMEKIPLIGLAAFSCGITVYAQMKGEAVSSLTRIGLGSRIMNAVAAYVTYVEKALLPVNLSAFYPNELIYPVAVVVLCGLLIVLVTVFALFEGRKYPYLPVGWFWYLGTLIPVIGLVQVGDQSMADRYTYIPLTGIFICMTWALSEILEKKRYGKMILGVSSVAVLAMLMGASWVEAGYWKDSKALFGRMNAVTNGCFFAHYGLGNAFLEKGDIENAQKEYKDALDVDPFNPEVHALLGGIMHLKGNDDATIFHYMVSLSAKPHQADILKKLGDVYYRQGNIRKAALCFQQALRENPDCPGARQALLIVQNDQRNHEKLVSGMQERIRQNPSDVDLYVKLGELYRKNQDFDPAIEQYQKALSLRPDSDRLLNGLVPLYTGKGDNKKAIEVLLKVKQLKPDNAYVYYDIACLYAREKMRDESLSWLRQSVEKGFHDWDLIRNDPNLSNIRDNAYVKKLMEDHGGKPKG